MKRVNRNRILVAAIFLGLANFAVYTFFYWYFQGDARNGCIRFVVNPDDPQGEPVPEYVLRGHFLRARDGLETAAVSRSVWIYSFVHSITIWPTIGAVLLSMFVLARPHIIATLQSDARISGTTVVNGCMLLVVVVTLASTCIFVANLMQALRAVAEGRGYGI
ncbi:MAG: hypothetical protein H6817_03655 [Phycisphaerales bacterium]|nr:hypothetical protein [Phycisphaerales bacterium]